MMPAASTETPGNVWLDRNMHVVERFSLLDANTILYRFEVEDPTAHT